MVAKDFTLLWSKETFSWHDFERASLPPDSYEGVYIIWHSGPNPHVVYVGQGNIAQRLRTHRNRADILKYRLKGPLLVTWAKVSSAYLRDGIERYLANVLNPYVGEAYPDVAPIRVNLPWN